MTIATNDIEQAQKKINELEALKQKSLNRLIEIDDLRKENNTLKQTINGLLDLDDQRLRKIEALKAENATLKSRYET